MSGGGGLECYKVWLETKYNLASGQTMQRGDQHTKALLMTCMYIMCLCVGCVLFLCVCFVCLCVCLFVCVCVCVLWCVVCVCVHML